LHYIPVHTHPYYQKMGFEMGDFPESEQYYKEAISLPMFPTLTEEQQSRVVSVLQDQLI
jgi:dTDP-4-amino-4,6-dideoxygalactose transaminase